MGDVQGGVVKVIELVRFCGFAMYARCAPSFVRSSPESVPFEVYEAFVMRMKLFVIVAEVVGQSERDREQARRLRREVEPPDVGPTHDHGELRQRGRAFGTDQQTEAQAGRGGLGQAGDVVAALRHQRGLMRAEARRDADDFGMRAELDIVGRQPVVTRPGIGLEIKPGTAREPSQEQAVVKRQTLDLDLARPAQEHGDLG